MSNQKERVEYRIPSDDLFFTQLPNQLIENASFLSDGAYRMFTYIWMRWLRNAKNPVPISYTEFQKKVGGSTVSIKKRQEELEEAGLVSIQTGGLNVQGRERAANVFRVVNRIELTEEEKTAIEEKASGMELTVYDVPEEEAENPAVEEESSGPAPKIPAAIKPLIDKDGCFPGGYVSLWHRPLTGVSTLVSTVDTGPGEVEEDKPLSHIPTLLTLESKDYKNNNTYIKDNSLPLSAGADSDPSDSEDDFMKRLRGPTHYSDSPEGGGDDDGWICGSIDEGLSPAAKANYTREEQLRKKLEEGKELKEKDIIQAMKGFFYSSGMGSYTCSYGERAKIKGYLKDEIMTGRQLYYHLIYYLNNWRRLHSEWRIAADSKPNFHILLGYISGVTDGAQNLMKQKGEAYE